MPAIAPTITSCNDNYDNGSSFVCSSFFLGGNGGGGFKGDVKCLNLNSNSNDIYTCEHIGQELKSCHDDMKGQKARKILHEQNDMNQEPNTLFNLCFF